MIDGRSGLVMMPRYFGTLKHGVPQEAFAASSFPATWEAERRVSSIQFFLGPRIRNAC